MWFKSYCLFAYTIIPGIEISYDFIPAVQQPTMGMYNTRQLSDMVKNYNKWLQNHALASSDGLDKVNLIHSLILYTNIEIIIASYLFIYKVSFHRLCSTPTNLRRLAMFTVR